MDWLSVFNVSIALIAIVLAYFSLRSSRKQQLLNAYIGAEEFLLSPDLQEGRAATFAAARAGALPADDDEYGKIIRAFAAFNTVSRMARRGALQRQWLLDEWHHHLSGMRLVFDSVLAQRATWHEFHPWVELDQLIADAVRYRSDAACCVGPSLSERAADQQGLLSRVPGS